MKKLIVSLMLVAFAVTVVQAGDDAKNSPTQDKPACCVKAKSGDLAKAQCPMTKEAKANCPYADKMAKGSCNKDAVQKQALASPKALATK